MKYALAIAALLIACTPAGAQPSEFKAMTDETGCNSSYSEEKRADVFASRYKDKPMTVIGDESDP
jgi:hypothetical protein